MKKSTLLRVIELRPETADCLTIVFEKPTDFTYQAGDCFDVIFPDDPSLGKQTYSFVSAVSEDVILLTFKKGYSDFKHRLEKVVKGDVLEIIQYGSNFVFDPSHPSVMIAGGVGIAPLRSMIKTRLETDPQIPTILIYQNGTDEFPFYKELKTWGEEFASFKIYWIVTKNDGRLTKDSFKKIINYPTSFHYYVSGPPLMVDSTMDILGSCNVKQSLIHTDSFDGYPEEV